MKFQSSPPNRDKIDRIWPHVPLQKIGNGPHGFSTQGFPNLLDIKSSILMAKITSHLPSSTVYQYLRIGNIGDTRRVPAALTCLYGAKVRESFLDGPLRQWCSFSGWAQPQSRTDGPWKRAGPGAQSSGESLRWAPWQEESGCPYAEAPRTKRCWGLRKTSSWDRVWVTTPAFRCIWKIVILSSELHRQSFGHWKGFGYFLPWLPLPKALRSTAGGSDHPNFCLRATRGINQGGHPTLSSQLQTKRVNRSEKEGGLSTLPQQTDHRTSC